MLCRTALANLAYNFEKGKWDLPFGIQAKKLSLPSYIFSEGFTDSPRVQWNPCAYKTYVLSPNASCGRELGLTTLISTT